MAGFSRTGGFRGPSQSSAGSVYFDRKEFDKLLKDHGYEVVWEKAAFCPNRPRDAPAPYVHDPGCRFCSGNGYIYFGACDSEMVIQAAKLSQQFYAQGRWDLGSVIVTPRPGVQISWWDRITLKNGTARYSEPIIRRSGVPDVLKYAPVAVEYVSWVNREGGLVLGSVSSNFLLNDNLLTWATESGPDAGSCYTISYRFRPRYVVQEMLHHHRESPDLGKKRAPFPVQAVAKLDFQIRDESLDSAGENPQDPFALDRSLR